MRRVKQMMSWLLVLVMMVSLMPANLARAEGEESEESVYSIGVSSAISCEGVYPTEEYSGSFSITVRDGQTGVVKNEQEEEYWNVTAGNTLTVTVTTPEDCQAEGLSIMLYGEKMDDVVFLPVEGEENTYAATITPTEDMYIVVCDGTYYSTNMDCVADNFSCYIADTVDATDFIVQTTLGESYVIRFDRSSENASVDNLSITINGESISSSDLVPDERGWSYTVDNVNKNQSVKVYEEGAKFVVWAPDVSAYGYAVYDKEGVNNISSEGFWEVANGESITFKLVKEGTVTDSSPFGLVFEGKELVPVDGVYTTPSITWGSSVNVAKKYTLSVNEESNVKIIPCDEDGNALVDSSVSSYLFPEGLNAYYKLDVQDYNDYKVIYDGFEYTPDENGVFWYWMQSCDVELTVTEQPKNTVTMEGGVKFIPCTYAGEELVDSAVTEYRYFSNRTAYFKLDVNEQRCRVLNDDITLGTNEYGVYFVDVYESDITLTTQLFYEVMHKDGPGYYIYMGSNQEDYDYGEMVDDYSCAYVPSEFLVSVGVVDNWNTDNMVVALKDEEGNLTKLTPEGEPWMNEWDEMQYDYAPTITENMTLVVSGIHENDTSDFVLSFDETKFSNVDMKIVDEESGETLSWSEDWDIDDGKVAQIYRGKTYSLVLSGNQTTLEKIRMMSDDEEVVGTIQNGELTVDVTNYTSVAMALDGEYSVRYDGIEDDTGCLTIREYQPDNLDVIKTVSGFYPGTLSFWIDSDDYNVSAEDAYVVSIKDSTGATLTPTTTTNVTVDEVGTKRTVYTVNFTKDITIQCAGAKYYEFDVKLPISEPDDYTISALYYKEDAEDENGEWYERLVEYTGVTDATTGYTTFSDITAGNYVYFDVITDAETDTPYVKRTTVRGGDTSMDMLSAYEEPEVLEDNKVKYTYAFYVDGLTDITVSVDTTDILVVADGCYPVYDEDNTQWYIYDSDPEEGDATLLLEIYNLPKRIDTNDTETKYYIDYYLQDDTLMVDDQNYNKFFTLQGDGKEDLDLTYIEDGDYQGCYEAPLSEGYTTLVVNTNLLEPRNGKVSLMSYRDDVTINIVGTEGEDYETLENQEYGYKVKNQTLTFTVTAKGDTFPEDVFVSFGYCEPVEPEVSADGLTRTYTLTDVTENTVISVSYAATIAFEESDYGWINPDVDYGQGAEWDENGDLVKYGTYGGGDGVYLVLGVKEGYDVESVKVIQKYHDAEGNEQTETYTELESYHTEDARSCFVVMQPGENTFSITQPKKITYKMNMPTSAAYTIEYVNGSTTTVGYNDSFSFKLKAKAGYDLSGVTVTADGKKMTPDAKGVYTITNVKKNYTVEVTGFATSKYVVTFKDYDGKVLKTQTVEYGKAAVAPSSPTRTGYTFAGWDQAFNKVTKDITVTATYKQVLVTKLTVTGDSKSLAVNKTMTLKTTALPATALNKDVVWTTSNSKYATVSSAGKVKALKKGAGKTVTITATAKDGSGVKATYKIKIYKNAVKKIKLSAKTKTVKAGKKVTIKAKFTPSKSICKTLKWTSSNKKWATVNSKGVVTTKKAGKGKTVKITAQAMDGSKKKATIKIKIKKK